MNNSTPSTAASSAAPPTPPVRSLADQVSERLRGSTYHALRVVTCHCDTGVVTLTGQVSSFHLKQMAQTIVGSLDDVARVDNRIEVLEHHDIGPRGDTRHTA